MSGRNGLLRERPSDKLSKLNDRAKGLARPHRVTPQPRFHHEGRSFGSNEAPDCQHPRHDYNGPGSGVGLRSS